MTPKRLRTYLALLATIAYLAFPSYFGDTLAAQKAAKRKKSHIKKRAVKVIELRNIDQLKEAFQRDAGNVRLVTILSPT